MKRTLIVIALLVLAGGGLDFWYIQGTKHPASHFRTAAAERGDLSALISATGTVEPEEVIDIGAQVAGQIKSFGKDPQHPEKTIDYRSQVNEGTILAQIDDALYQSQYDQARANLQRAEADLIQMRAKLQQTDRDWKRARELGPGSAISELDYDTARASFETARSLLAVGEASVTQAKASLKQAETNLSYTVIKSPVKGVIIDRRVNIGQTVVASLNAPSLFLIAKDLTRLQIWASVNEADVGVIHPGQKVRFTVDAYPEESFAGEVAQIRLNASMTQNVVTYTVVVNTDNRDGRLLPYMTANVQFLISERLNVLRVPNAALRWRPQPAQVVPEAREAFVTAQQRRKRTAEGVSSAGSHASQPREQRNRAVVWVEQDGFVRPVKVHMGLSDGVYTEITDGELKESDAVVVGEVRPQENAGGANPFTPQLFNGRKKEG